MDDAELLLVTNPDSAQLLLDESEFFLSSDDDFARWCLLSGKVEDERHKKQYPRPILSVKNDVLYHNYQIEKAEDNLEYALSYLELYQEGLDSLLKEQNRSKVHEIEKKYDKSQIANERNRIQIYLQRFIIIGLAFSIAIAIVFLLYIKHKNDQLRTKENEIKEMDKKYHLLFAKLKEKESVLSENERQAERFLFKKQELESSKASFFIGKATYQPL